MTCLVFMLWILLAFVVLILLTFALYWNDQKITRVYGLIPTNYHRDIDFVVTWVDSRDPVWIAKKNFYSAENSNTVDDDRRFGLSMVTNIEIETCIRSILKYAPWAHRIWLVTDNQQPLFLSSMSFKEKSKIRVIYHNQFMPEEILPTFNSHTIEANLYKIPELAERFIYMNDDSFFTNNIGPEHFFENDMPVYRSQYMININSSKIFEKIFHKTNPSSIPFLRYTANLEPYGNKMFIWRYKHHSIPLTKTMFAGQWTRVGKSTDCLCKSRFRTESDVPPMHCAVLTALKNRTANIYNGPKYHTLFSEKINNYDLKDYHECCINDLNSVKDALHVQKKALS